MDRKVNNHHPKLLFLILIICMTLSSIWPGQYVESQTDPSSTYENKYYGFSLQYPSGWEYAEPEIPTDATVFSVVNITPPVSVDPNLATNLEVGIEYLDSPIPLDLYARNTVSNYRTYYENFSLTSADTNVTLAEFPAYELVFTYDSNGTARKSIERGFVDEETNAVYYISLSSDPLLYDYFDPLFQSISRSFEFDKSTQEEELSALNQGDLFADDGELMAGFDIFMESFENSIFNGSSVFGAVGTSMVEGIKISGINIQDINKSRTEATITLMPNSGRYVDNITDSVTITAIRIPLSMQNLLYLGALGSSDQNTNPFIDSSDVNPFGDSNPLPFSGNEEGIGNIFQNANPFDFLPELQIGSTNLVGPDWSTPHSVTMDLKGGSMNHNGITLPTDFRDLELIFVSVIPFTG